MSHRDSLEGTSISEVFPELVPNKVETVKYLFISLHDDEIGKSGSVLHGADTYLVEVRKHVDLNYFDRDGYLNLEKIIRGADERMCRYLIEYQYLGTRIFDRSNLKTYGGMNDFILDTYTLANEKPLPVPVFFIQEDYIDNDGLKDRMIYRIEFDKHGRIAE